MSDVQPEAGWRSYAVYGAAAGLCMAAGTAWSSWPLLAAAVCLASAWAWRVTRL